MRSSPRTSSSTSTTAAGSTSPCSAWRRPTPQGNVNVSRFGGRFAGAGGFINITQNARALVFAGTFTAGGLKVEVGDGRLRILQEGRSPKFVGSVEQITFNGKLAAARGQAVLYVTERCVFRLTPDGLELAEVAPGVELERDILGQMAFRPIVRAPRPMDARLFRPERMDLEATLLGRPLAERFTLDPDARDAVHRLRRLPGALGRAGRGGADAGGAPGRAAWAARSRR